MGIKERRSVEKSEMKKRIREAAIELIAQEGYEKLSIRKIANKIEYSPTTIYLYYKDKAEIITDMSDHLYSKVMSDITTTLNMTATVSLEKRVHEIMYKFVKGLSSEPEMIKAIMNSGIDVIFANESTVGVPSNPGIIMFNHFLEEGINKKVFRPSTRNNSWMIISAMLGFIMSAIGSQLYLLDNFDQLVHDFVQLLLGGIKQ